MRRWKARNGKRLAILLATLVVVVLSVATWLSWPYLRFWWLFKPIGVNAEGLAEYRHRKTGITFVRVPGGTFWMGAQKEDPNGPNYDPMAEHYEAPVHRVTLTPFLIAKYELTQAEWRSVLGTEPSHCAGDDLPVENVSWYDCLEFCYKSELRLPTEAQWEYACRAGNTRPFSGIGRFDDMGWYELNSGGRVQPVGKKLPNALGLHDMHGNVSEWCADEWNRYFYSSSEAGGQDPCAGGLDFWCRVRGVGDWKSGEARVRRGGDYGIRAARCRSADREAGVALYRGDGVGFRVAYYPLP